MAFGVGRHLQQTAASDAHDGFPRTSQGASRKRQLSTETIGLCRQPSNIMVEQRGDGSYVPVVMDFGLAREAGEGRGLTESGAVMGTPAFMSPEQARGEARHLDRRSDVYSLGATLFEVLSGRAPFDDDTVINLIMSVMTREAPLLRTVAPALPEALEIICARCLTKDKEQRYPTAQALADDLTRFLHSEKIVAKKVGLLYRLKWRAQQNKPAAALVLSLFASVVGFAGYGLRQSYVARKQSELQRHIAQDSKDIEWMIRTAYSLPLHNVEREQDKVRKRMDQVEYKLRTYGDLAAGLGHYALGRGHLSLHQHKKARQHLEQARDLGEKGPELHAALGRVLGELYHEALLEARRSGEKTWVEKRQKELQAELLDPATLYLQKALSRRHELSLDSPEYIDGLLDFYSGREQEADYKAQLALVQAPWLSEAAKLRGEIAQAQALRKVSDGQHDQARTLLSQAIEHFRQASDISRSDGLISAALSRAYLDLADLDRLQGKPQEQDFEKAQAAAEKTITALPSDASGYLEKTRILYFKAKSIKLKGNKIEILNEAIQLADIAIGRDKNNFIAWDVLGNALTTRGIFEQRIGKDPITYYQKAEKILRHSIELAPNFPWGHNDLGICFTQWGNYILDVGKDPREQYRSAIDSMKHAISLDSRYVFAYGSLVGALSQFSDYSLNHGQSFDALMRSAEELTQQCGTGCSSYLTFQRNMAVLWINHGLHLLQRGDDPTVAVSTARGFLARQRQLDKNMYSECLFSRYADFAEAGWALKQDRDPTGLANRALAATELCKRFDDKAQEPFMKSARFHLIKAQWQLKKRQTASEAINQALADASQAVSLDAESVDSWVEKARASYYLATTLQGSAQALRLGEALAAVERGLKVNGSAGPLWALHAVIRRAQARAEKTPDVAMRWRKESDESWNKALAINPLLKNDYGDLLGE